MNKSSKPNKIKTIARVLIVFLKIAFVTLLVALSCMVIGEVVISIMPQSAFGISVSAREEVAKIIQEAFGYIGSNVSYNTFNLKLVLQYTLPVFSIGLIYYLINTKQLQKILENVAVDQPFHINNSRHLLIMAINHLASSVVFSIIYSVYKRAMLSQIGIHDIVASLDMSLSILLTGLLLLILYGVFKYGNHLQYEYDKTV